MNIPSAGVNANPSDNGATIVNVQRALSMAHILSGRPKRVCTRCMSEHLGEIIDGSVSSELGSGDLVEFI